MKEIIQIIGMGGAGCNVINYCLKSKLLESAELIAVDETDIEPDFNSTRLIIVVAGLGGRYTPHKIKALAAKAKEHRTPLATILILPFAFEGKQRLRGAEQHYADISPLCDWHTTYHNARHEKKMNKKSLRDVFTDTNQDILETVSALVTVVGQASEADEVIKKTADYQQVSGEVAGLKSRIRFM